MLPLEQRDAQPGVRHTPHPICHHRHHHPSHAPALFTSTSTRPHAVVTSLNMRSMSSRFPTLAPTTSASLPMFVICTQESGRSRPRIVGAQRGPRSPPPGSSLPGRAAASALAQARGGPAQRSVRTHQLRHLLRGLLVARVVHDHLRLRTRLVRRRRPSLRGCSTRACCRGVAAPSPPPPHPRPVLCQIQRDGAANAS